LRGGALPPALLLAALGLALGFGSSRTWAYSLLVLGATLAALSQAAVPPAWLEIVFLGCWASTAATAAAVHLPRGLSFRCGTLLSINAGVWAAGVAALSGSPLDLMRAAPAVLVVFPAAWLVARRG
jgi:hypothetical protein